MRVEDAVDELCRFKGREAAGDLQSFVDNDGVGRVLEEKFVNREAKNVAVDDRHSLDAPVFGPGLNAVVDRRDLSSVPRTRSSENSRVFVSTDVSPNSFQ